MENAKDTSENEAFKFWRTTLNSAKFIVAPMVDQSELAWRLLSRRHNAQLCYTPMFHAQNFVNDPIYRRDNFQTCPEDRPLIVQFCANDPDTFAKACQLVENDCDAVDLNLGCPQTIAKRGHYGAFLQDEWPLIESLVKAAKEKVRVPICCKIRVFECVEKTIKYARMLEKAGCQLLVVHGRTREQKGRNTGIADWSKIKAVKEAVSIPVVANGNIQFYADVEKCLSETGVDGVMSAEGNLHNPYIFEDKPNLSACWEPALEYLDLVEQYPCSMTFVRGHLFKLFHFCMLQYPDLRERMAVANTIASCRSVALELKTRTQERHEKYIKELELKGNVDTSCDMEYFWLCRPYVRPPVSVQDNASTSNQTDNDPNRTTSDSKRQILSIKRKHQEEVERLSEQYGLSKNKAKKLMRFPNKNPQNLASNDESKKPAYNKCFCGNPLVVLKIIQHSEQDRQLATGELPQGYLTGLVADEENNQKRLEVTNCFPRAKIRSDDYEELGRHQAQTLKAFRQVNIDYLMVGWYQCVPFGASFSETMVESMFDYQTAVEESVVLIYDPVKTSQGLLSIKAYRLSAEAMKLCYNDFSPESVKKSKITYENLFEELPITIKNSSLANICLTEMALLGKPGPAKQSLDLGSSGSLEKCLRETMSHVDTLKEEVNKFIKYTASKQRYEALRESLLQKRRLENEHRRANREPLLPAEDESMKLPRMPAPPSMLDGLLNAADINAHVDHTLQVAAQNLSKLFMAESVVGSIGGQTTSKERTISTAASTC